MLKHISEWLEKWSGHQKATDMTRMFKNYTPEQFTNKTIEQAIEQERLREQLSDEE